MDPFSAISRFGTMLHLTFRVKKPLYENFHNFSTKIATPIELLDLEPD